MDSPDQALAVDSAFAVALLDEIGMMPIFQGLGLDYLWQENRALPFLQMRLRWFAQAMMRSG